ncbi:MULTISPECIES: response regulator transcription factor [Neobacillus]|uniref:Response regulator n=1 Tax=Neobacillus rhizophilus TaxID=2833579 RepID=A0A942YSJ7_9BACI|nr:MULTISPECIES: response regulator [Neobacillus]MBS4210942.1 response regulator [Neobacillus rhizophilus]
MYQLVIADDEYEIRHGLVNYFPWNELGFEVIGEAANGKEALELVSEGNADVLLCDIQMPIMTGIEVIKEMHEQKSPVLTVFLSGYQEFHYAQSAIKYGVKNYILKPTNFSEITEAFSQIKKELDQRIPASTQTVSLKLKDDDVDPIINKIKDYVKTNFKNATLDEAAQVVYMNPHYVSKYFKQKTDVNFSDFLFQVKMEEAAKLIKEMKYKTYEVSEMVGYSNAKNFTRAFRKYFGVSPKEYRLN